MAVDIWQRRVLPQGGIDAPRETSIGETIGQGLQDIGQAGIRTAGIIARVNEDFQQKNNTAWLGNQKPQAELVLNKQINDLNDPESESYVDPTSEDYETELDKVITDYASKATKEAPSPEAGADLNNYIASLRVGYTDAAGRYSTQSKYAKRITEIDESNRKYGTILVQTPTRFDGVVAEQEKLIRTQIADPLKADAEVAKMKSTMAGFAMNGQASSAPQQFLAGIGQWGEKGATPQDLAQAQGIAEAEIRRQQAEAKQNAREAQARLQANTLALSADAVSSAQVNGGVVPLVNGKPMVTEKQIRLALADDPVRAQREVDKLNAAMTIGQAKAVITNSSKADDDRLIASVTPTPAAVFTTDDAAVQTAILGAIKAKRDALADEIKQDITDSQNEAQNAFLANFDDNIQTAAATGSVPEDVYVSLAEAGFPAARAAEYRQKFNEAVSLGGVQKQIEEGTVDESNAIYQNLLADAKAGGPGSASAARQAAAIQKEVQAKQAAFLGTDPAGAAVTYSTGVQNGWQQYEDTAQAGDRVATQAAFRNAINLGDTEQDRQGVPEFRRKPLPDNMATGLAQSIAAMPNPKRQIDALMQYVVRGDPTMTRKVMAQIAGTEGALPEGIEFVIDAMDPLSNGGEGGDPARAERMLAGLLANTKGITLTKPAQDHMDRALTQGLLGALSTQASLTGDINTAASLAAPVRAAVEQSARAKVSLGMDPTKAVDEAISDFTGTYAVMNDPGLAAVYYPKVTENQAPGAIEAGLTVLRRDQAARLAGAVPDAAANPYVSATARDIETTAVWVNQGDGFALIVPGSTRALAFVGIQAAQQRGIAALASGEITPKAAFAGAASAGGGGYVMPTDPRLPAVKP